jgi:hypothetical protein
MSTQITKLILGITVAYLIVPCGRSALADPPVAFPPNTDLDSNGSFETEFSKISQTFLVPANGGRISFDWQLFSSEFFGGGAEDVFYVRLFDTASAILIDEVNGALDPTPAGYSGTFTPIGAPPMGTTGSSEAPAGPPGLMFDAFHVDGGTGWTTGFLSITPAPGDRMVRLEILVADTFDRNADTSLAIDKLQARSVTGGPITTLINPSFEAQFNGWTTDGNVGIYATLDDLFLGGPEPGTGPTDGEVYALISTAGVPEPTSTTLLIFGGFAVVFRQRRAVRFAN